MVENIRRNGFTLVELIFILSIIFLLLAVAIPNYSGYKVLPPVRKWSAIAGLKVARGKDEAEVYVTFSFWRLRFEWG
jgi:Tfp pilus assembly major pilin PilA